MSRLYWIELAGGKQAPGRNQHLMELIYDGGLANTRISADEHQLRPAADHDTVEGREQCIDLPRSPVQFLGNQQSVRRVMFAKRKLVDTALSLPLTKAAPKITLRTRRCLVAVLSRFGQQLLDDGGDSGRDILHPLSRRYWLPGDMAVHPFCVGPLVLLALGGRQPDHETV